MDSKPGLPAFASLLQCDLSDFRLTLLAARYRIPVAGRGEDDGHGVVDRSPNQINQRINRHGRTFRYDTESVGQGERQIDEHVRKEHDERIHRGPEWYSLRIASPSDSFRGSLDSITLLANGRIKPPIVDNSDG